MNDQENKTPNTGVGLAKHNGYGEWKREDHPTHSVVRLQKKVDSDAVCQTNGALYINIDHWVFKERPVSDTYTVEIVAEKNGVWWTINAYSIQERQFCERLKDIESDLIRLFNAL